MPDEAMGRKIPALLTLSRTHFFYVALICLIVLPALSAIVFSPILGILWCDHFEIPEYERSFGFRMETFQVPSSDGGTYPVRGIGLVEPGGLFEMSGVRAGDIPRQHHGTELCGVLSAASKGFSGRIDMVNVDDLRSGQYNRREVTIRGRR